MKAAIFYGKHDLRVEETEVRHPKAQEVLIRVKACGVCGTDLHIYEGAEGSVKCPPKTILGHEFSGVVEQVGKSVKSVKPGDSVTVDPNQYCGGCYYCRMGKVHFCENLIGVGTSVHGAFAEYFTINEKQVYKFSKDLPFEVAAMSEPVACCLHAIDLTGIKPGHTVMIIGGGTIGLIMLQLARNSGASTLVAVEPVAAKRALALKLGADIAIDPLNTSITEVLRKHSIKHIDSVIECAGLKSTVSDAVKYAGKGGTVMLFGLTAPEDQVTVMPFDLFKRELTIKSSFVNPLTQQRAISLLETGRLDVSSIITDHISLSDINKVFEDISYRKKGKVMIFP